MRAQHQVALRGLTAPTHRRPRSSGRAGLPAQAPARLAADASARGTSLDDGRPPNNTCIARGGILHVVTLKTCP